MKVAGVYLYLPVAGSIIRNTGRDFRGSFYRPRPSVKTPEVIPTEFLYFIYLSRPPKMLKYVRECQNKRLRPVQFGELSLAGGRKGFRWLLP